MDIKAFEVEEWMNKYEDDARYNIAETCVESLKIGELLDILIKRRVLWKACGYEADLRCYPEALT